MTTSEVFDVVAGVVAIREMLGTLTGTSIAADVVLRDATCLIGMVGAIYAPAFRISPLHPPRLGVFAPGHAG